MIPWHPYSKLGPVSYLPVVSAYKYPRLFDWQSTLLGHALASFLVAVPVAVTHAVIRRLRGRVESVTFTVGQLLAATGILAVILGLLAWCGSPPVVFCAIVLLCSGWPIVLFLAGIISRQMMPKK